MSDKPKLAMYWAAGCGGCEIALLNTQEKILEVDARFEVAFCPLIVDAKYRDVEAMPDGSILLTLWNGGIRNDENERLAHLLRRKSKILVAFGSCAYQGGIPGLANLGSVDDILQAAYAGPSTDNPALIRPLPVTEVPEGELEIPALLPALKTLEQVVEADYIMPGCPPESHQISAVIDLVLASLGGWEKLPPRGSIIGAGNSTVCDECSRARNVKRIKEFRRIQEAIPVDPQLCLLEQGLPCNGPATRSGCLARCPSAGNQCIGCYGPAAGVLDYGARLISAFASVIDADEEDEIERILDGIPDPAGQVYRFSLAGSLLHASRHAPTRPVTESVMEVTHVPE